MTWLADSVLGGVAVGVVFGVVIGAGAVLLGVWVGLRAVARWYRQWIDGK